MRTLLRTPHCYRVHAKVLEPPKNIVSFVTPWRHTQMMSKQGHPDILSGVTDDEWRLFRKGCAPAFNPVNIRCVLGAV